VRVQEPASAECVDGVLNGRRRWLVRTVEGLVLPSTAPISVGGMERRAIRRRFWCLAPCWVLKEQALLVSSGSNPGSSYNCLECSGCGRQSGPGGWSLFENCTVDASIFVVKLPRANGECLGTRSR
jgi:hypothetical protein